MSEITPPGLNFKEGEHKPAGLHVKVLEPQKLFKAMLVIGSSSIPTHQIQDDQINDALCGRLTSTVSYYSAESEYNPNSYNFTSVIHNEGRKLSQLMGFRGYVDSGHLYSLISELQKRMGGDFSINQSISEKQTIQFDQNGEQYYFDLGFTSPAIHTEWIKTQIADEKSQGRVGYYTAHPDLLNIPINDNISIGSIYHKADSDLKSAGVFKFKRDLESYAAFYENCLHALYSAFNQTEPNKDLLIKPR